MNSLLINPSFGYGFLFIAVAYNSFLFFIQCYFLISFTKVSSKKTFYLWYLLLSYINVFAISYFHFSELLSVLLFLCTIYIFAKFILKQSVALAIISSLLIYVLGQLALGIVAPLNYMIFNHGNSILVYQVGMMAYSLLTIIIITVMYRYIAKKIELKSVELNRYFFILLAPMLLLLSFFKLTENTGYWDTTTVIDIESNQVQILFQPPFVQELQVFCISLIAFASIFAILFSYQKVIEFFYAEQKKIILEQQIYAQKNYIKEAKSRITQTLAFQHDFKNHLSIVNGLLEKANIAEAIGYLNKLEKVTNSLSFLCNTGNPTVDALFCNKLSIAKQMNIEIECEVTIPFDQALDDLDLCIIFANAIDNAITACLLVDNRKKYIKLSTKLDGNFFMIEISNSFNPFKKVTGGSGIGISNMQEVAKKYNGALSTDRTSDCFVLNILLILSGHLDDISEQLY
ncbi:Sensor histidine kinase YesM [Anaerovirgula multivorans]|uniref:Sensor histidine kinase YesM n=1 Tax=Anaerovirgula multivorans TaxID=312168 RepID=A0A239IG74_9FIRM|nr:ATP-binding protein [Anaerovirgula multivorans]SNS92561.1 Sensor histidine kinase YesM [Anaerovirgula multivorans]